MTLRNNVDIVRRVYSFSVVRLLLLFVIVEFMSKLLVKVSQVVDISTSIYQKYSYESHIESS